MKKIFLVLISASIIALADMSRSSVGVVIDSDTTLEWQDDYSDNGGSIKTATWQGAIDYCESLSLDGINWRLPNNNELLSIVVYTNYNPSIDTNVFQNTISDFYWSSTSHTWDTSIAWTVRFYHGIVGNVWKSSSSHNFDNPYVRCVRSEQ